MTTTLKKATLQRPINHGVQELWLDLAGDEYRVHITTDGQVLDARRVQRFGTLAEAEQAFAQIVKASESIKTGEVTQ